MLTPNPELTALCSWLAGGSVATAAWLLTAYRGRVNSVRRATLRATTTEPTQGISVIVVSGGDAEALSSLLPQLLDQQINVPFEVIVVNDGKNEDVKYAVDRLRYERRPDNLKITFTPPESRNVSHRKLSITLGIKASRQPVQVILNETCTVASPTWLSRIAAHFNNPATEVVIGCALPEDMHNRYRTFTHGADAVQWLSAALRGATTRGERANLAYRRQTFFDSRGFSSALNLRYGEDDIYIRRIATPGNVAVELSPEAMVRYASPSEKDVYVHTRPRRMELSPGHYRLFDVSLVMLYLLCLCGVAGAALSFLCGEWILGAVAAVATLATWITLSATWRRTLRAIGSRPTTLMVIPMLLRRPWTNLRHRFLGRRRHLTYRTAP